MTELPPVETLSDVFYMLRSYFAPSLTGTWLTVAVLDTGVDAKHPDLAGRIVAARKDSRKTVLKARGGYDRVNSERNIYLRRGRRSSQRCIARFSASWGFSHGTISLADRRRP